MQGRRGEADPLKKRGGESTSVLACVRIACVVSLICSPTAFFASHLGERLGFALRLTEKNKAEVTEKEEKETMKNMLMSVLALGVTIGLIGAGTYAYFSDVETANNLFSAGTLDLQLSEDGITYYNDPVDPLIVCVNMAPGDETDPMLPAKLSLPGVQPYHR